MIKVGIQIDDERFAHAFSKGLAKVSKSMMFFLLDHLGHDEGCDLLLSFESSDRPEVIELTKDPLEENIYGTPPYKLFCYKDSRRLTKDLLFLFYRQSGKNLEPAGDRQCRILAFASTGGGCGCTAMALGVAKILYRMYGCKCLYLNLCPVNDGKRYLTEEEDGSLLTLLCYLDGEKDFPISSFISKSLDVDYINTDIVNRCFDELDYPLLNRLLQRMEQLGEYDFLVVDMSNHLSRNNKKILKEADYAILLRQWQEEPPAPYFTKLWQQLQEMLSGTNILEACSLFQDREENDVTLEHEARRIGKQIMEEPSL